MSRRLKEAREDHDDPSQEAPSGPPASAQGLGLALRLGVEFVAAVGVGAGIGYYLDRWLDTGPWLLLVFFLFGAATGFRNVIRAASEATDDAGSGSDKTGH